MVLKGFESRLERIREVDRYIQKTIRKTDSLFHISVKDKHKKRIALKEVAANLIHIGLHTGEICIPISILDGFGISTDCSSYSVSALSKIYPQFYYKREYDSLRFRNLFSLLTILWQGEYPYRSFINLKNTSFWGKTYKKTVFIRSNFRCVDFCESNLINSLFHNCLLHCVDMEQANASKTLFYKCYFDNSYIRLTSFEDTLLYRTSFRNAQLYGVNFSGAQLYNVDFKGAVIDNCCFENTIFKNTRIPPGLLSINS